MATIAIFGNDRQPDAIPSIGLLLSALAETPGTRLRVDAPFGRYLAAARPALQALWADTFAGECPEAELALSFGGDGTFLHTAGRLTASHTPLMGINTGHLGFLAGVNIADAILLAPDIAALRLVTEARSMLEVQCAGLPADFSTLALNEVAILKKDTASMVTVDTRLDGEPLADYCADGLIISSPTGSTGYNLSVGGPIVHPGCRVMVISPVAPHTLTQRPLVVADPAVITATVHSRSGMARLSVDGRSVPVTSGTELQVRLSAHTTLLAHPCGTDYLQNLRSKLHWGL